MWGYKNNLKVYLRALKDSKPGDTDSCGNPNYALKRTRNGGVNKGQRHEV